VSDIAQPRKRKPSLSPSTRSVGRGRPHNLPLPSQATSLKRKQLLLTLGNSLNCYDRWESPKCIISDGAYGILGFEGDTASHLNLAEWYEPHVAAWAKASNFATTLWFWNSEIGWATVHPILEQYGFRYVSCNIWNKGHAHIAGNVSTKTIRRFPVVTEVCAHYVFEPKLNGMTLKRWLLEEWKRSGLKLSQSNAACGVADAATRKYLTQSHLWYFPPPEAMQKLVSYANLHGHTKGRPYFSLDGKSPVTREQWERMRAQFDCPHGMTNVWERAALRNTERVKSPDGKAVHLNQKPLDLMEPLITTTTNPGEVVWEPFGGLFSGTLAAFRLGRKAFAAEIDPVYFAYGMDRFKTLR